MKRLHLILCGALVLQIALAVVLYWPRSVQSGPGEPLLTNLAASDIVALTVADAEGNQITLRKNAGAWVLAEADDYPAAEDKVTPVLDKLVAIKTGRLVTRTEASHRQLQVAGNFALKITLQGADGASRTLLLGSSPAYGATHVRLDGQNEVYLTDALTVWELGATASTWVDTAYLEVPTKDITALTVVNAQGTLVLRQASEGVWALDDLPAGETLDQNAVASLVRSAASLRLDHPLGKEAKPEYGLDQPLAQVTLETAGETITLRVGSQNPTDASYAVSSSRSPYIVAASEYSVAGLVNDGVEALLQQPEPTPGAAGAPPSVPGNQ